MDLRVGDRGERPGAWDLQAWGSDSPAGMTENLQTITVR
jgi:hypothetical protein